MKKLLIFLGSTPVIIIGTVIVLNLCMGFQLIAFDLPFVVQCFTIVFLMIFNFIFGIFFEAFVLRSNLPGKEAQDETERHSRDNFGFGDRRG